MDIWLHFFWVDLLGIFTKKSWCSSNLFRLKGSLFLQASGFITTPASNWEDSLVFYYVCNCYLLRCWKSASGEERKSCSFLIGILSDWKSFDFLFLLADSPVTVWYDCTILMTCDDKFDVFALSGFGFGFDHDEPLFLFLASYVHLIMSCSCVMISFCGPCLFLRLVLSVSLCWREMIPIPCLLVMSQHQVIFYFVWPF